MMDADLEFSGDSFSNDADKSLPSNTWILSKKQLPRKFHNSLSSDAKKVTEHKAIHCPDDGY